MIELAQDLINMTDVKLVQKETAGLEGALSASCTACEGNSVVSSRALIVTCPLFDIDTLDTKPQAVH